MGFWNALSVLAPVAPALSDAQDINTQRQRDAASFAQDQALKDAQATAQKLAAQATQQQIFKDSTIRNLGWNPVAMSDQSLIQDPSTGALTAQNVPGGIDPSVRYQKTVDEFKTTTHRDPTPEENQRMLMQSYGMTGSPTAGMGVPKAVTIKGPDGKPMGAAFIGGRYYGADGQEVANPEIFQKPLAAKVPTMKAGTIGGKSAWAYYSLDKGSWIDSNTGQPVSNFIPQPSFAQTGLYGLDTGYDANGNPVPVLMNRRNGQVIPAPAGLVAPAQSKGIEAQRTAAIAGDALLRTMLGAADRAKAGDQQAMLSIVANHIGMTLGAQKGARINQAVWNEAVDSSPWLQNVSKRWGPDGYLQGVSLSPQQVDQMVELGKLRRDVMWQQAAQTAEAAGVPLAIPDFQANPKQAAPKGTVALQAGGRTYNIPVDQVAAFRKDHPDATR